jgi:hypothetical protein
MAQMADMGADDLSALGMGSMGSDPGAVGADDRSAWAGAGTGARAASPSKGKGKKKGKGGGRVTPKAR